MRYPKCIWHDGRHACSNLEHSLTRPKLKHSVLGVWMLSDWIRPHWSHQTTANHTSIKLISTVSMATSVYLPDLITCDDSIIYWIAASDLCCRISFLCYINIRNSFLFMSQFSFYVFIVELKAGLVSRLLNSDCVFSYLQTDKIWWTEKKQEKFFLGKMSPLLN